MRTRQSIGCQVNTYISILINRGTDETKRSVHLSQFSHTTKAHSLRIKYPIAVQRIHLHNRSHWLPFGRATICPFTIRTNLMTKTNIDCMQFKHFHFSHSFLPRPLPLRECQNTEMIHTQIRSAKMLYIAARRLVDVIFLLLVCVYMCVSLEIPAESEVRSL